VSNQLERERIARCDPSWPIFPLKRLARLKGGGTPSKENESFWTDGEIPWVSPKDMKRRVITETEDHITAEAVDGSATSFVEPGSPLVVVRSGILRHTLPVAISGRRVTLNQDMKAFTLRNNVDAEFFTFWIEGQSSELLLEWRQFGATVESIDTTRMMNALIALPDLSTQKAIADFLDRETARIDQLIDKKKRLIVLLREKDDAVCTHAVTCGLHGDMALIDSRNIWLRMVPQNWRIIRLKYLFRLLSGFAFKSEFFVKGELGLPVLVTPGSFDPDGGLYPETDSTVQLNGESDVRFRLEVGDIVIALTDLSYKKLILGRCEFIPSNDYVLNQRVAKVQALRKDVIPSFLRHAINSRPTREQVILGATGATVFHSSSEKVRDISICLPPIAEQQEIAKYLDSEMKHSIEIGRTIRTSIDRLYELRSALITAAVTGQIDIATWGKRGATDQGLDDIEAEMATAAPPERERARV
jgi:type I restriction enzyme S subunit